MNTAVWPVGPKSWDVTGALAETVGRLRQHGSRVLIEPRPGSILDGIPPGPYRSRDHAMQAIAAHTGGTCMLGGYQAP